MSGRPINTMNQLIIGIILHGITISRNLSIQTKLDSYMEPACASETLNNTVSSYLVQQFLVKKANKKTINIMKSTKVLILSA